jgi:hypothetical protein
VNPIVKKLVPGIVTHVVDSGGYVTKTKLLKLLYLVDVEYYRAHRATLTGFDWKFFHLGPWAGEYDRVIDDLVSGGDLIERIGSKSDYETKFYHVAEPKELGKLFPTSSDEFTVRRVLNAWGSASTGEILDYVYFHTEPMENGVRNQPLDFSSVRQDLPEQYARPSSGTSASEIEKLRKKFRVQHEEAARGKPFAFTPPRYDEEFQKGVAKLESSEQ